MEICDARTGGPGTLTARRPTAGHAKVLPKTAALVGLAVLAACTSTESQMEPDAAMLPRPQIVVVDTFAASAGRGDARRGLTTEVEQAVKERRGTSRTHQEVEAGRQVADAIADKLVVEIQDMGLPPSAAARSRPAAERGADQGPAGLDRRGQPTERVIIGLGAGRSDVRAHAQVYEVTPTGSRLIDTIEVDAKSGLAPGMAETMGVGGLTGHLLVSTVVGGGLHVADEALGANVVADADRAAKGIAKQLAALFAREGWTS